MNSAAGLFERTYRRPPGGLFSAPGRVNLIGEHTDYNNGLVLPFAIDARAHLAADRNEDGAIRIISAQRPGAVAELAISDLQAGRPGHDWADYLFGSYWSLADFLAESGQMLGGVDMALDSRVPVGAGLSSSAAVECSVVLAVSRLHGIDVAPADLARIAQRAENDYVGIPCGLMDQMASAVCRKGNVLYFDTGAGTTEQIPFDPSEQGLRIVVIDTKAHHSLADGEYARRRASCEQAAAVLGIGSLREIAFADLDEALARLDDDVLRRRTRHVVTENERVLRVVEQLRVGSISAIGPDMTASHKSLRDDYEVSAPELDVAVEAALQAGALGARMTGGGFGGSVIALMPRDLRESLTEKILTAFAEHSFTEPVLRDVVPADGARVDTQVGAPTDTPVPTDD